MQLKYPLARLFLLYKLHGEKMSCSRALVDTVYETGLIEAGSLDAWVKENPELHGSCGAMLTAKRIAEESLKGISDVDDKTVKQITDSIMEQIGLEVKGYNKQSALQETDDICDPTENSARCGNLAPLILDFLIQKLGCY